MLVLGYIWLPFVALPIFVSLESLDRRLLEAANDLGASRLQAFRRITLPLSHPGVVAAFLFVFIPTLGEFVTPSLVGGATGYMYGNQIVDLFGTGFPDWETGSVLALFLLGVVTVSDVRLLALPSAAAGGGRLMRRRALQDRARALRVFFALVVVFLYAPILILLIFSFNNAEVPSFPLSGFTLPLVPRLPRQRRPPQRARDECDHRGALERRRGCRSGILSSLALSRRRLPGKAAVSALLLSPLVIPYVVFGISLLLLFHTLGIPRGSRPS